MRLYEVTISAVLVYNEDDGLISSKEEAIADAEEWLMSMGANPSAFEITVKAEYSGDLPDRYGREWDLLPNERCAECGQPDSVGDCNHQPLTDQEVARLKGE